VLNSGFDAGLDMCLRRRAALLGTRSGKFRPPNAGNDSKSSRSLFPTFDAGGLLPVTAGNGQDRHGEAETTVWMTLCFPRYVSEKTSYADSI
jgi:hypothetical protein